MTDPTETHTEKKDLLALCGYYFPTISLLPLQQELLKTGQMPMNHGRGGGHTFGLLLFNFLKALQTKNLTLVYQSPVAFSVLLHDSIRKITEQVNPKMLAYYGGAICHFNATAREVTFWNGSKIKFVSQHFSLIGFREELVVKDFYGHETDPFCTRVLLLAPEEIIKAQAREVSEKKPPRATAAVVSMQEGQCLVTLAFREGNKIVQTLRFFQRDSLQVALVIGGSNRDHRSDFLIVDATGHGVNIYDLLMRHGVRGLIGLNQEAHPFPRNGNFLNLKAQMYATLAKRIKSGEIALRDSPEILESLQNRYLLTDSRGVTRLEPVKTDSDTSDAIAMLLHPAIREERL